MLSAWEEWRANVKAQRELEQLGIDKDIARRIEIAKQFSPNQTDELVQVFDDSQLAHNIPVPFFTDNRKSLLGNKQYQEFVKNSNIGKATNKALSKNYAKAVFETTPLESLIDLGYYAYDLSSGRDVDDATVGLIGDVGGSMAGGWAGATAGTYLAGLALAGGVTAPIAPFLPLAGGIIGSMVGGFGGNIAGDKLWDLVDKDNDYKATDNYKIQSPQDKKDEQNKAIQEEQDRQLINNYLQEQENNRILEEQQMYRNLSQLGKTARMTLSDLDDWNNNISRGMTGLNTFNTY